MLAIRNKQKIKNNKIAVKLPEGYNEKEAEIIILIKDKPDPLVYSTRNPVEEIILPKQLKKSASLPIIQIKGKPLSSEVIEDRR